MKQAPIIFISSFIIWTSCAFAQSLNTVDTKNGNTAFTPYCLTPAEGQRQICARMKSQDNVCKEQDSNSLASDQTSCILPSESSRIESILSLPSGATIPPEIYAEHDKVKIAENMVARLILQKENPQFTERFFPYYDDVFYHNTTVIMAIEPETLEKIIQSEFLNQFQTGNSKGTYTLSRREKAEAAIIDLNLNASGDPDLNSIVNFIRPKYTYLMFNNSVPGTSFAKITPQYGHIFIKFKNDVKKRTTVTIGDSLDSITNPSVKRNPRIQSFYSRNIHLKVTHLDYYYEAQIWGPLRLSDIDTILVDCWNNNDEARILQVLKDHNSDVPLHTCRELVDPNGNWLGFVPVKKIN